MLISKQLIEKIISSTYKKMSVYTQKLNPITGLNDWELQDDNYDYHQEVARSSYADMLHDTERNRMYDKALKLAIEKLHSLGKKANVLDIGTGTGLLSMMAVRNGADLVTACEAFSPMSKCAQEIIKINDLEDKIKVVHKRSTELTVGQDCDLHERANILVTEVFDTELIGEGALRTFDHAHKVLLEKECIVIPSSATIYAQVVESPLAQNWNKLKDYFDEEGEILLRVPESIKTCPGIAAVHDLQLSQFPEDFFNTIISPMPVLRFDWSGKTPCVFERSNIVTVKAEQDGTAQLVFMWWELQMDTENKVTLSCAPRWAHPLTDSTIPWRDHWIQGIYYLPKELHVNKGDEINLLSCHDEFSLWFNLKTDLNLTSADYSQPVCECGVHISCSRTRIGQLNDGTRNKKYVSILKENITEESYVLILSDGFYLALAAAKLGAAKVFYVEDNSLFIRIMEAFIETNELSNIEIVENVSEIQELEKLSLIFGEPYFTTAILPWDNLLFTYLIQEIKDKLAADCKIVPRRVILKGVAVEFTDLHKIRAPLGECEGFNMQPFDDLIEKSSVISDSNVEPQPLWEYPCKALSETVEIANLDCMEIFEEEKIENNGTFTLAGDGNCNGIALWVEWDLDESPKNKVTTGPKLPTQIGETIRWDIHTRQGVCLFSDKQSQSEINYSFTLQTRLGDLSFKFD